MKPLHGVRVVDLSRLLPGPFCTQLLADLGAEVIKVEEPNGGDYLRHMPPQLDDGTCVLFHALNRGKKSVCLDLKNAGDVDKFKALVKTADVVVESFRPGVLEKLGLAPAKLLELNPRVVVCSISGYGQTGAYRLRAGHDINYLARAGALGMPREPALLPVQVADIAGGAMPAALQILAALLGRANAERAAAASADGARANGGANDGANDGANGGKRVVTGAIIDVSMTHNVFGLLSPSLSRASTGESPLGGGRDVLVGRVPCYAVYPTKDGFISVGSLEPKFWHGLCAALEMPELADRGMDHDEDGVAGAAGTRAASEVRAILSAKFRERTSAEWHAHFAPHDVCVEVIRTPEEALASGEFPTVNVDIAGKTVTLPVPPPGILGVTPSTTRAPLLGEHTAEILGALR